MSAADAARSPIRKAMGTIGVPFRWIERGKPKRARIIYPLVLITLAYIAAGFGLATTQSDWRASDTYSMVAGCLFFVIGTSLAVAHENRQEEQERLMTGQAQILRDQAHILRDVKRLVGETNAHLDQQLRKLGRDDIREVTTDTPDRHVEHDERAASPAQRNEPSSSSHALSPTAMEELVLLEGAPPLDLVCESLRLFESSDEKRNALQRFALESAIEARADTTAVQNLLKPTQLYALGTPAGDTSVPGEGTESDLLHFTIDDPEGKERTLMPLFTRLDVVRSALLRNPDWQSLSVLEVNGGAVIVNRDTDVFLVINPWSKLEWQLNSPDRAT